MSSITLGIVPYLNTLPLLEGLEATFPEKDWIRATPRELAGLLETQRVDIAEVSVFEGIRAAKKLRLLPGAAICSDGAVRSVALFSKVPLAQIRNVLLDRSSLTSINLVRILLRECNSVDPEYSLSTEPIRGDYDWRNDPHDALAVIGDTALQWENTFPHQMDMGLAWKELTGLPFVFAGWWLREGVELTPPQIAAFGAAGRLGAQRIDTIIERLPEEVIQLHGGRAGLYDYFTRAIRYELGEREIAGLELFREKLIAHELVPHDVAPLRLVEMCV